MRNFFWKQFKNNWTEGDVITAEKLNNIEDGVSEVGRVYETNITLGDWELIKNSSIPDIWSKEITEEEYLNIKSSNQIKINVGNTLVSYYLYKGMSAKNDIIFLHISTEGLSVSPGQPGLFFSIILGAGKSSESDSSFEIFIYTTKFSSPASSS